MNTVQIECFLAAANCLNFTTASQNLHISQPALSKNIASLEEELGVKLFTRSRFQKLQLTRSGELFFEAFTDMTERLLRLTETAREMENRAEGLLVIGVLNGQLIGEEFHKVIDYIMEEYPDIRIIMERGSYSLLLNRLNTGELDAVITTDGCIRDRKGLKLIELYETGSLLVVPRLHPKASGASPRLRDFADLPFICVDDYDYIPFMERIISLCEKDQFIPTIHKVSNLESALSLLQRGEGVQVINAMHGIIKSRNVASLHMDSLPDTKFMLCVSEHSDNPCVDILVSECEQAFPIQGRIDPWLPPM